VSRACKRIFKLIAILACAIALAFVAAACGGSGGRAAASSDGARPVTLVLNWTPNAHHLGVYAARQLGWYRDAGIDLKIVEPTEAGAEQAVGQGKAQFGISMAEGVLPAREQGIPIVSIGTILPVNDSSLMSLTKDGITQPKDLAGKVYGGYNGPLELELINRLAKCGGIDPKSVKHIEIGNVDYLAGLEANRYDVVWVFSGWDALRATDVEHKPINQIRFSDYTNCIPNWYTPLFITNEKTIRNDPDLVRKFMAVTARGYNLAIADPSRAADLMMKAVPEMDSTLIQASAKYYAPKFTLPGQPFGMQDHATWRTFEQFLVEAKALQHPVNVDQSYTNQFLPK
jgi:ABC-type nitrate/sulfonate/bicarbonate transport system substrate-binding protein